MLLARVNEKRQELENLKELRDLSAGLAGQMSVLEEKLATLSNGTEGTSMPTAAGEVSSAWQDVVSAAWKRVFAVSFASNHS